MSCDPQINGLSCQRDNPNARINGLRFMQVIPAIDLRGGLCVRLGQGITTARRSSATIPRRWPRTGKRRGRRRIHLVDLDGAKAGRPVNVEPVRAILARVSVPASSAAASATRPTIGPGSTPGSSG